MTATNDPFANGAFSLERPVETNIRNKGRGVKTLDAAGDRIVELMKTTPESWKNYTDPFLYEYEKDLRAWFAVQLKENPAFTARKNAKYRKYTLSMMMQELYGRPYTRELDGKLRLRMHKVLQHYSSKVTKSYTAPDGTHKNTAAYTFSIKRIQEQPPYSMKLRLEYLQERGQIPTKQNMLLHTEELKPGHARSKKTEAHLQARVQRGKENWNRYVEQQAAARAKAQREKNSAHS